MRSTIVSTPKPFGDIRLLRSEEDYEAALAEIEIYFDKEPLPGSADGDRFDLLAMVITRYEEEHYPIEAPSPIEMIKFVMESRGLGQEDLAEVLGSRSRASEILSGKRSLSLDHIRRLHQAWGIPAEGLIGSAKAA
jgi:HTH-type transcriptional regulator/antitoxin HigA